jgi:hypothetical protein
MFFNASRHIIVGAATFSEPNARPEDENCAAPLGDVGVDEGLAAEGDARRRTACWARRAGSAVDPGPFQVDER